VGSRVLPLIIIVGPTAVGKSAFGVALAKKLDGEIISGDSVQIYRRLNIGSAKPSVAERCGIVHHLIDCLDPDEPFSVVQFQSAVAELVREIRARGRVPLLVGGTGLYIRAVIDEFGFAQQGSAGIRAKWEAYLHEQGKEALFHALMLCDPASAQRLHPHDTLRIIRALEVYDLTGIPLSSQRDYGERVYPPLRTDIIYLGLTAPRDILYQRINERCRTMYRQGLIAETLALLQDGFAPTLKPLQSIGYRHAIWYIQGLVTESEMLRLLARDTRRFAKRQLTWFNRDPRITWFDITLWDMPMLVDKVAQTCRGLETRVE